MTLRAEGRGIAEQLLRTAVWPLVDIKNGSCRMREFRRLMRSQRLPFREIRATQLKGLQDIIQYAYEHVPYYSRLWGSRPELCSLSDLSSFPLLTKSDIRAAGSAIHSNELNLLGPVEAKTGGSTGVALALVCDFDCQQRRNAAALRANSWAGWQPAGAAGALWGNPPIASTLRQHLQEAISERLIYLDTMAINETSVRQFLETLKRRAIPTLFGHAHSIYVLAKIASDLGLSPPKVHSIVTTSMVLSNADRAFIEEYFGCPATDRYGCEEVSLIASECEQHQGLHINVDHLIVEVIDSQDRPAALGEMGRIVVTDLLNRAMPLIRYVVGDMSSLASGPCACGRDTPRLERILGREADFLKSASGSLIAGISLIERTLTAVQGLRQLQIVQKSLQSFTLNIVLSGPDARDGVEQHLEREFREVFGQQIEIQFTEVSEIPQETNGKYRFSKCLC